jgi:hypothetical protein
MLSNTGCAEMGNDLLEIRAHVRGMIDADRAMLATVARQLRSTEVQGFLEARRLLERIARTLNAHIDELEEHLRRLGGDADRARYAPETLAEELMSAVTDSSNVRTLSRTLRDYYTALSLAHAAALLLETDARARSYSSTAAMATRHREEIAAMLSGIRDLLPVAIKEEISHANLHNVSGQA